MGVLLIFLLVACTRPGTDDPTVGGPGVPTSTVSPSGRPDTPECSGQQGGTETYVWLTDVSTAQGSVSDTVTFQFQSVGDPQVTPAVPKFELAEAAPPFADESDRRIEVDGVVHYRLIFHGATGAHTEGERVVETYKGPREFKPGFPVLAELELLGDFEATLSWIAGISRDSCPKVQTDDSALRMTLEFPH